jgi:hypothetical protein
MRAENEPFPLPNTSNHFPISKAMKTMRMPNPPVPGSSLLRWAPSSLPRLAQALIVLAFCGCIFQEKERTAGNRGGGWEDFPNANLCGDLTSAQRAKADSLVQSAKPRLDGEADFLSSDTAEAWSRLKRRDVDSLGDIYSQAVEIAPNHCGALFGKAIVTAYSVIEDPVLDSLVREAEGSDLGGAGVLAKLSAQEAGPTLLDVRRGLASADKSLLTLTQELSEQVLLPKLDSAILGLERVVGNPEFRFRIGTGDTAEDLTFDRGEAAPLLATLKIAKALVILVAGYEWRVEFDESYPHFKTLRDLQADDLDSLTPDQKAALDHYTGLLRSGSAFTHIRAGWAERTASIPSLLDQAVGHVQAGLEYGILQEQKKLDQSRDPYRVGTDEGADIDPADLRDAIDRLERVKKYLRGEVLLSWARNSETLRIDFPKVFRINGIQGLLPYFRFRPYAEWNDNLPDHDSLDSGDPDFPEESRPLKVPIYFTNAAGDSTLDVLDMESYEGDLGGLTGKIVLPDPTMGGVFPDLTNDNFWIKAQALGNVDSRVPSNCNADVFYADSPEGCRLPVQASDLDILVYFLGMGIL